MCFVSLLSRTAGRKAESTDLLITLANCIMTMTENGLQEVNAQDLLVQFLHFDLNGHQDDQFESAIAQVLFQDDGKSGEDRMALLQMVENVTSRLDLQPLIVPSSKPHLYEKCSMTGWLQKLDDKNYSTPIPTVFNVELTEEMCNKFNITEEERTRQTDDKKPYRFEIVAGTPILCYRNSENSRQVQGFVKQSFHDQSYVS
uniref:Uncharacterized protein n=1 Tax=Romanomermis culicivorax TaxID=13658 RepID=A0A915JM33_ROMCU